MYTYTQILVTAVNLCWAQCQLALCTPKCHPISSPPSASDSFSYLVKLTVLLVFVFAMLRLIFVFLSPHSINFLKETLNYKQIYNINHFYT